MLSNSHSSRDAQAASVRSNVVSGRVDGPSIKTGNNIGVLWNRVVSPSVRKRAANHGLQDFESKDVIKIDEYIEMTNSDENKNSKEKLHGFDIDNIFDGSSDKDELDAKGGALLAYQRRNEQEANQDTDMNGENSADEEAHFEEAKSAQRRRSG